jgi:hypothetical protein
MKKYLLEMSACVMLICGAPIGAEADIGFGGGLDSSVLSAGQDQLLGTIHFPIRSSGILFEPTFGLLRSDREREDEFGSDSSTQTLMHLGVGLFYAVNAEGTTPYYGGRVSLLQESSSGGSDDMNFVLSAVAGGEHFFGKAFSLGVEIQLNHFIVDTDSDTSRSLTSTNTLLIARFYPAR